VVIFIDAIVVKVREGQLANRPMYAAIGSPWRAARTCSGSRWAPGAARDMERAQVRSSGFVLLPEVFSSTGVSLVFKV
jgi:hypothetical protein